MPATSIVQVDTSAPTTPTVAFSNLLASWSSGPLLWYRPGTSGGFTITASSDDPESGVGSYTFPNLGSGWTMTGSGYETSTIKRVPVILMP